MLVATTGPMASVLCEVAMSQSQMLLVQEWKQSLRSTRVCMYVYGCVYT